jgi:hypothetical protein
MRRATITCGAAVAGVRNVKLTDKSEYNGDRADDEASGTFVRMTEGPYDIGFEMLARDSNITTGYKASLVVTGKEISVANATETSVSKTWTLSNGYLVVDADLPIDGPGRIPVRGEFSTMVET